MTNAEEIRYKNLLAKYEKAKAKLDIVEQENDEYKKEVKKLKKEIGTLEKNNAKLEEISNQKCDKLYEEISKINTEVFNLKTKKKEYEKTIKELQKQVEELKSLSLDLKASKIKDSSNSSKPSSTNGFKKVIQNNRVKSGKKKGGQKGREGKTLKVVEKVDKIKDVYGKERCECGGKIIYDMCEYIRKQVIDILNDIETIEYRYHKGKCEKCGKEYIAPIPKEHANPVQYSGDLKVLVPVMRNVSNMSVATIRDVLKMIYKDIPVSIGWIHKQEEILAKRCEVVYRKNERILNISRNSI